MPSFRVVPILVALIRVVGICSLGRVFWRLLLGIFSPNPRLVAFWHSNIISCYQPIELRVICIMEGVPINLDISITIIGAFIMFKVRVA